MRITAVDMISVAAIAVVAALIAIPRAEVARMMDREDQVILDLNDFARRLEEQRRTGKPDADGDGRAEYAPLETILGSRREQAVQVSPGIWSIDGYRFAVMLPGGLRRPVLAGTDLVHTDYAELAWMIVAWPAEPGVTGMRAYAVTTYGLLLHQIDGYPYGDSPPYPDGPMVVPDGERMRRIESYRGEDWRAPLRAVGRADDRADGKPPKRGAKKGDEE